MFGIFYAGSEEHNYGKKEKLVREKKVKTEVIVHFLPGVAKGDLIRIIN